MRWTEEELHTMRQGGEIRRVVQRSSTTTQGWDVQSQDYYPLTVAVERLNFVRLESSQAGIKPGTVVRPRVALSFKVAGKQPQEVEVTEDEIASLRELLELVLG